MKTYKLIIPIKKLFQFLNLDADLQNCIQPIENRIIKIKSPSGDYVSILGMVIKEGWVRKYTFPSGNIICDEKHLVKQHDKQFIFINSATHLMVDNKPVPILSKSPRTFGNVYDVSLGAPHEYITTSGVQCHNTTAAKILANAIDCDTLMINASDENNVDTIRNKVRNFASSIGFKKFKLIVLDECLEENTLISVLRNGKFEQIPIKDLNDDSDLVQSYNEKTEAIEWSPFKRLDKGIQELIQIDFESGETIKCTRTHKWYVKMKSGKQSLMTVEQMLNSSDWVGILTA